MFTGITEQTGRIDAFEHGPQGGRLRIGLGNAPSVALDAKLGDSIMVNGCCLTAVELGTAHFSADLSGETLRRTSFGEKKAGDLANLERPLAAGARLGGHFVQGHVDGVGRVVRLTPEGENWWLSVRVPGTLRRYVVEKGSIAIDGISLTVARWQAGVADIAIIPFTYSHTNVHAMIPNDAVNIEVDILAKYVESLLEGKSAPAVSHLSVARLREEGF
ncbi:MAG TPA: riboflavin synthase [Candidatus Acidoferrum sp.]|nr:riboflavin synthase [Candidatus Acidoferrum sp.]